MARTYREEVLSNLIHARCMGDDFDLNELAASAQIEIDEYLPKIATYEQGIVAFLKRHGRSDYVQRDAVYMSLAGVEDAKDARHHLNYMGEQKERAVRVNAYCFTMAFAKLQNAGVVKFRGHGGYYLADRGDPSEVK